MNLIAAKNLAIDLMKQHINTPYAWHVQFDNAKARFGCCSHQKRTIYLSRFCTMNRTEDEVKNTILHEIAHVIAGPREGHGYLWRVAAKQVGINNPSRLGKVSDSLQQAIQQNANYIIECPNCGPLGHANRMGKTMRYGSYTCQKCGTKGLKWERN